MNIQNMIKQAQKLQQEMMRDKEEIDKKIFPGKYSFIEVEVNGKKEIIKIKINKEEVLKVEDVEMLEDMIVVAINAAFKKVDEEITEKMSKYGPNLPNLF